MSIYNYEEAFGAADKTTPAMKKAIERWFALYYDDSTDESKDPGQRIVMKEQMKPVDMIKMYNGRITVNE